MKIVLVAQNSSYTHTNAAVRILKCCLEDAGHTASIVETTVNDKGGVLGLCERLVAEKADMYAFSVYIWNREQQILAASSVKKLLPSCLVVFGGPEVSYDGDFFEKYPFADYLIRGEGEKAICDIANGKYPPKTDVNADVYEGFSESDEPYYSHRFSCGAEQGKLVYYESLRGCPYSCSYCLSSVKKTCGLRKKSVEKTVFEVETLMAHTPRAIKFVDRTFNADIPRARLLFSEFIRLSERFMTDGIYKGPNLHFEICAALIDCETVEVLKKAPKGLFRFEIGLQSVNENTLSAIGRKNDTEKILFNVNILREKTNIELHIDLISGLPHDTYDGMKKAYNLIYGKCDMLQLGILKLLPGTKMREDAERYSISYLDTPPYTVLETSTMSFCELRRLSAIADATERFSGENSGFYETVKFLVQGFESPFDFFEALSIYLEDKGNVSSKKLYAEMLHFAGIKTDFDEQQLFLLRERLRFDYLMSQQGAIPHEISHEYSDDEKNFVSSVRRIAIALCRENGTDLFVPATEIHVFGFDCENVYIIDRKNRVYIKEKSEKFVQLVQQS